MEAVLIQASIPPISHCWGRDRGGTWWPCVFIGSFINTHSSGRSKDTRVKQHTPPGVVSLAHQLILKHATPLVHLSDHGRRLRLFLCSSPALPYTTGRNEAGTTLAQWCLVCEPDVSTTWVQGYCLRPHYAYSRLGEAKHLCGEPQLGSDLELRWRMTWRPVNEF